MSTRVAFEVVREQRGKTVRLAFAGELDIATAPELRERHAVELSDGAELIVLDLTHVTFMDSSGLHALLNAHQCNPDRLRIILSPAAARLIELTGARKRLPIINSAFDSASAAPDSPQ